MWICILLYASSIVLGVGAGLLRAHYLEKDFPNFFSPLLYDTEESFYDISTNIRVVDSVSDENLTIDQFVQSRWLQ